MEHKIIKQIKTSCPFPLLIYKAIIKYDEVKRASGIAYILLDLIENSTSKLENITEVLLKFDIPKELHHIFGHEINKLISSNVLQSQYSPSVFMQDKYLANIKIGEISLTEKGMKMFKEGAIPTGIEKELAKIIYFSPVTRKFNVVCNNSYSDISSCPLGESFLDGVNIDISNMEDYVKENYDLFGLNKKEKVVSVNPIEREDKVIREDDNLTITIASDGISFDSNSTDKKMFLNKYYDSTLISYILAMKNKFQFSVDINNKFIPQQVDLSFIKDDDKILLPSDLPQQVNNDCVFFVARNRLDYKRNKNSLALDNVVVDEILHKFDECAEYILFDECGGSVYSPITLKEEIENFRGTFHINLLICHKLDSEKFLSILKIIFNYYLKQPFNAQIAQIILYIAKFIKEDNLFEVYTLQHLAKVSDWDDKILLLNEFNSSFKNNKEWNICFKNIAQVLFDKSIQYVQLTNFAYKNDILSAMISSLGISKKDYLNKLCASIVEKEDADLVFKALLSSGYTIKECLGVVNVIENYSKAVVEDYNLYADNDLANKFSNLRTNIWKMNHMLGIKTLTDYSLRDDYSDNEFFNIYSTIKSILDEVSIYKDYAKDNFDVINNFMKIYQPIHETLSIEKTASFSPEKINKKYINDNIARGKFKQVVCDLLVKLQFDLRNKLDKNNDMDVFDLINKAQTDKFISNPQAEQLHKLRILRNSFLHPERKQISYDEEDINNWENLVFDIGEKQ